ncbi:MAG TPA: PLP-dependent aminotransferase family protein [Ktedonobacterales bacterium]|nr:PLP-dependent aminotransferase family protein [Ktedonobacterales bacterium]
MTFSWSERFAERTIHMSSSAIRELLKITERPDFISFAGGLPAPEVFPVAEVAEAAGRILRERGAQALQYGATEGYRPLREWVAARMTGEGLPITTENVLITTGSQQALDLVGKILVDPGSQVLVESPTYLAALQAWNTYGAEYAQAPADGDGMRIVGLERLLRAGPRFVYCLPNFQNPGGVTLTRERRERLVALAEKHGVPVVEDDPYRELRFDGEHLPRLIQLDAARRDEAPYAGNIIYTTTFSKILSPGLRVGWVIAAREAIAKLTQAKQGTDLHTPTFNQMIAYELASTGFLERHAKIIVQAYRERRDVMLAALATEFPASVTWTHPQGGMFLWVTLPNGMDAADLLRDAIEQKVAFVPGAPFHTDGSGANTLRLNFSNASTEMISEGIQRLGVALRARLARQEEAVPA